VCVRGGGEGVRMGVRIFDNEICVNVSVVPYLFDIIPGK